MTAIMFEGIPVSNLTPSERIGKVNKALISQAAGFSVELSSCVLQVQGESIWYFRIQIKPND